MRYYIGTNKGTDDDGIYVVEVKDNQLTSPRLLAPLRNPTWIDLDKERQRLYVCETIGDRTRDPRVGYLKSFRIAADGSLMHLSTQATGAAHPCYVWHTQTHVYAANYGVGSIASCALSADGMLSEAKLIQHQGASADKRQTQAHAHQIVLTPDQRWAFSCDLGADKIFIYKNSAQGLSLHNGYSVAVAGSGPRHLVMHSSGKTVYVLHEITGVVDVLSWNNEAGVLGHISHVDLPGDQASDLRQCGQFLYAGLRSNNTIIVIDAFHEREPQFVEILTVAGRPRGFALTDDGAGLIVGNEQEDQLELYHRHVKSGLLGKSLSVQAMPSPVCVCSAVHGHRQAVFGL